MFRNKRFITVCICVFFIHFVKTEWDFHELALGRKELKIDDERSSLTFVIDNTGSMSEDIAAVKKSADATFDAVLNSNDSHIEDFVLVTVNDPDVAHVITTKDREKFKIALENIQVYGGNDCPEMILAGIELAIKKSRPGSLVYVFTDASAKDRDNHDAVKNLAYQKWCKVSFVLTGTCSDDLNLYNQIAKETSGQVFLLRHKDEVEDILKYVQTQISSRKTKITREEFPAGSHSFEFKVDSRMSELIMSVSGNKPEVVLTSPDGRTPLIEDIVTKTTFTILKLPTVMPGIYHAEVISTTNTSVIVTVEAGIEFEYGFIFTRKWSRPKYDDSGDSGDHTGVLIRLIKNEDVIVEEVLVLDDDNTEITSMPLSLYDQTIQLYKTEYGAFVVPYFRYKFAIIGHDKLNNEEIIRYSPPITPKWNGVNFRNTTPIVKIIQGNKVNATYNQPLTLNCEINAYPLPKIVWQKIGGNDFLWSREVLLESTVCFEEHPRLNHYLSRSTLSITRVIENATYYCIARNDQGLQSKRIHVITNYEGNSGDILPRSNVWQPQVIISESRNGAYNPKLLYPGCFITGTIITIWSIKQIIRRRNL